MTGYHRGCYQNFTKNLNRLKDSVSSIEVSTSRSSRKRQASLMQAFPAECIFYDKLKIKASGRCSKFALFKKRDETLKECS